MKREPKHLIFTADLDLNAETHVHCAECGAPVGEPCKGVKIHARRQNDYRDWLILYHTRYREEHIRRCAA